jgi:hypothetical protein
MSTYSADMIMMSVGGVPVVGLAKGTFVKVEYNEDTWKLVVGADGHWMRIYNPNRSGKVTLTVMQDSPLNSALSGFAKADRATRNSQIPFALEDPQGGTSIVAALAWVVKMPSIEFSDDASNREWVLESGNLDEFLNPSGLPYETPLP